MSQRRADICVAQTSGLVQFNGGGTQYVVQTPAGVLYLVYCDTGTDLAFRKSTNNGITWSAPTKIFTGTLTAHSIWYDRWSGIAAGKIHIAFIESVTDDILYRNIDTESSDTLSSQTTIFAGTSTAAGGYVSISRARGGNLYCLGSIDAGAEGGFFRSTDVGANWGSRTINETLATQDQAILLPGWAADNQDMINIFWDASANEISRQLYDDSANSWAETSIATSMNDVPVTGNFPNFAATVDITNSQHLLVAWPATDTANADLRCWKITESAITEVTNVVLNSVDDQGLCGIAINTDNQHWYAFYGGKSDGSETFNGIMNLYYKVSTDGGSTWGAENLLTSETRNIPWMICTPRFSKQFAVCFLWNIEFDELMINVDILQPRSANNIGI